MVDTESFQATQIGLHSVKNLLGVHQKTSLFSDHDVEFSEEYGFKLEGKIDRFGIDLTDIQSRVMEGILYGFSKTAYRGNTAPETKENLISLKYSGKEPDTYKYVTEIPKIRATQTDILEWSGINKNSIACWSRAIEAIEELGRKQYCFYYDRLALDEEGIPTKGKNGEWKKEEVIAVDSLFFIKEIRDENTGNLKYYEIMPSAIFLDQRESYFMFIPLNWREEVKALVGNKKASSYTFRFLLFLRYQYELKRRVNSCKPPYQIKWSAQEIARAIKMPESIYLRKKKRLDQILDDAYSVAKRLGYLQEYERKEFVDILTLNDKKFFNGGGLSLNTALKKLNPTKESNTIKEQMIFNDFYQKRKKLDPHVEIPKDEERDTQLQAISELLKIRKNDEIEKLMLWSLTHKFWGARLFSPCKLQAHFSEAWSEMMISRNVGKEITADRNRELASKLAQKFNNPSNPYKVEALTKYVEIGDGVRQPTCISYNEANFEEKLNEGLKKWGLHL